MKIQTKMLKRLVSILCAATMVASGAVVSVGAVDPGKKVKQSNSASVGAGKGQDSVKPGYLAQYKRKLDFNKKKGIINLENIEKEQEAKLKKLKAEIRKETKNLDVKIAMGERKNKINEKAKAAKARRDEMEQKEAERNVKKANIFSDEYKNKRIEFNALFNQLNEKIKKFYDWNANNKPEKNAIHSILTKHNNLMKQCGELKDDIKKNDAYKRFMPKTRKDKIYMLDKPLMERISKTNKQLSKAIDKLTKDFDSACIKLGEKEADKKKLINKEADKKKLINKEANKNKIVIKKNKVDNTNKSDNTYKQICQNKQKLIKINNKAKNTKKTNLSNKKK